MAIEIARIDLDTRTMPRPTTPTTMNFKSQLEAMDECIARLEDGVKNLSCETKIKSFTIVKQVKEIQHFHRFESHVHTMDDILGPMMFENMLKMPTWLFTMMLQKVWKVLSLLEFLKTSVQWFASDLLLRCLLQVQQYNFLTQKGLKILCCFRFLCHY